MMHCLVAIDDTDSSRGCCTTYLAYRIATDLRPDVSVIAYPRLVRLNPNIPFKTRGNAAVCLHIEASDPEVAFEKLAAKITELSDVGGGANSGMVFVEDSSRANKFEPLYLEALTGIVSPHKVRRFLRELGTRTLELGNGMGLVGAASALGFDERFDHTYELIAYRKKEFWGTQRVIDSSSVRDMDSKMFPHTFNNYDYQKRKVLIAPHGPDPVFAGVRGDSPNAVIKAFNILVYDETIDGRMVYISNQHTDAHLKRELNWKVYSSGWVEGTVTEVRVGAGGHVYLTIDADGRKRFAAAYEPTGDLRRTARLLKSGDKVKAYGGVRRATSLHPKMLNLEKFEVISSARRGTSIPKGTYISSPRANRHLTKPLIRYGLENHEKEQAVDDWLDSAPRLPTVPARSR
ncbi:MAG TPA: tRNA(Ile)(2)-agmatinylcytidine synthase [Nitrososphaerales archaeon]|nr:tRNA(Ile)(2)-agmatinylcytidine synthase [Nitrososphaerales archaeon]